MNKTRFYNKHRELGAKIVEFANYLMPVQYSSIIAEHKAVRSSVGVFDVSHMGEIFISGDNAPDLVQYVTVNDTVKLFPGRVQYSAMCYEDGGIVDDLLVYKISARKFMLVVNASNITKDLNWLVENNKFGADIKNLSDEYSLLAVQGPNSKDTLQKICADKLNLEYYHFFNTKIEDAEVLISRTGYTGELGYEIYFKSSEEVAEKIWNKILEAGEQYDIRPIGLGARDTLRLEMGFCLYGNDIDRTTNPLEAGLGWITKLNKDSFIGKEALLKVKSEGIKRKLTALVSEEKAFPRHGYDLMKDGLKVGTVTSGTVSPTLDKPIALGYVEKSQAFEGNELNISIRGKNVAAVIVNPPFVKK